MYKTFVQVGKHKVELGPLDVIRAIATRFGYEDVDCDPGLNGWSVEASGGACPIIKVSGATLDDCCTKFVDRLLT